MYICIPLEGVTIVTVLLVQQYSSRTSCLSRQHNAETGLKLTTKSANFSKSQIGIKGLTAPFGNQPNLAAPR